MAGKEYLNNAERLAADSTFRLISSQRIWDRDAALTLHRLETELLTREDNLIRLMAVNRETAGQAERPRHLRPRRARHGLQLESGSW